MFSGVADAIFLLSFSPERFGTRTDVREERKKNTAKKNPRIEGATSEKERKRVEVNERREGQNAKTQRMNKIGDVEYFALGSSGHFTRHFNP